MGTASEALRHHHEELTRKMAEQVAILTEGTPRANADRLVQFLRGALLPHAAGEERYLYPAVEPLLKAHGMATATMRMDHRAIEGYVQSIEHAANRLSGAGDAGRAQAARELQRLAWQLQALFEVHLQKEEQIYMPLFDRYVAQAEQQHVLRQMHGEAAENAPVNGEATLDVRTMAPARRHAVIFATYEALGAGQTFVLVNDHDPKPLYYQFQAEQSGKFMWTYLEQGPEVWRVRIGRP